MEEASWWFFVSIIAAYVVACGGWLVAYRLRPGWWPEHPQPRTDHKWLDLGLVLVAALLVLGLGQVWRAGWLLPEPTGWIGDLTWTINNLIIYAPLALILAHRGQSTETVYLGARGLPVKIAAGLVLGGVAVAVYTLLRREPARLAQVAVESLGRDNLRNFVPVFLEGVALAFAFVRVRWALGLWPALVLPGVLFAAAHIPRQLESGLGVPEMAAYFAVTMLVALAVLYTLQRSADIIWLGLVHYLMDVAIGAFD